MIFSVFENQIYLQSFVQMKILIPLVFFLAFLTQDIVRTENRPLKAMLYCYLPAVNTTNQLQEYGVLAGTINAMLQKAKINVQVQVCDQNSNATNLYDENKINSYFDSYDIIEIDVVYLWAITQKLMTFKQEEIDYYDKVFHFEWEPLKNGNGELVGSPGLLCSNFHQARINGDYHDRLYSDYESKFALTALYLSYFINNQQGRNLHNIDYSNAGSDAQTIEQMAHFLKECQDDRSQFIYQVNKCLHWNWQEDSFFEETYSRTIGYSENLFNFQNFGTDVKDIKMSHIIGDEAKKKLFYMDSFIAKDGIDRKTVLDFYRFMLTDEVLDLYVNGKYTKDPKITYILPPTVEYFDKMSKTDKIYEYLKQKIIEKSHVLPAYHQDYTKNIRNMKKVIRKSLETYSSTQKTNRASHKITVSQL